MALTSHDCDSVTPRMSPEELDSRIQAAADLLIERHPVFRVEGETAQQVGAAGALIKEGIRSGPVRKLTQAVMTAYIDKFQLLDILGVNNGKDF